MWYGWRKVDLSFFSHVHAPSYPRSSPVLDIGAPQRIRNRDTFETRRDEMSRSDLHNSPWNSAKISTWLEPNPLQVEKAWLVVVNYLTRPLHMSREAAIFGVQVEQASHRISWPTYLLLSVNLHMELGHYFLARAKYLALWARPTQQGTRRSGRILPPSMFGIDSPNLDDPIRLVWEFFFPCFPSGSRFSKDFLWRKSSDDEDRSFILS